MTTATDTKLLTAGELLRLYSRGVRGELIRGVLHATMPTGQEHGEIVVNLGFELGGFVKPRRLGRLTGSDAGVWLERDPDTVREPDVAFFSAEKVPPGMRVTGYSETVPDLVAEVVSPGDRVWVVPLRRVPLSGGVQRDVMVSVVVDRRWCIRRRGPRRRSDGIRDRGGPSVRCQVLSCDDGLLTRTQGLPQSEADRHLPPGDQQPAHGSALRRRFRFPQVRRLGSRTGSRKRRRGPSSRMGDAGAV